MTTEHELIALLARRLHTAGAVPGGQVLVAQGDDAAVVAPRHTPSEIVATVDAMVEDRHFARSSSSPADVGWKLVAVNVSDLAAMGAVPLSAVVALCRPDDLRDDDVLACYDGMRESADAHGIALVGGDVVGGAQWAMSLTAVGWVEPGRAVTRAGAAVGDVVVVAGHLGGAAAALGLMRAGLHVPDGLAAAHRRPRALVGAGRVLAAAGAHAMIDVSDGLGADLGHVCRRSGVAARVDVAALPVADGVEAAAAELGVDAWRVVVGGGDDYALVATLPPAGLAAVAAESPTPVVAVGEVVEALDGRTEPVLTGVGEPRTIGHMGFDHSDPHGRTSR